MGNKVRDEMLNILQQNFMSKLKITLHNILKYFILIVLWFRCRHIEAAQSRTLLQLRDLTRRVLQSCPSRRKSDEHFGSVINSVIDRPLARRYCETFER